MDIQLQDDLRQMRNLISIESADAIGLASRVEAIIGTLSASTMNVFEKASGGLRDFAVLTSPQRDFLSLVGRTNYADLAPVTIYKPEGLQVGYLEYLDNYLIPSISFAEEVVGSLTNFTAFIGRIVNNKNDRGAINEHYAGASMLAEERYMELTAINSARQGCIKTGMEDTEAKVEDLVFNNQQWRDIFTKLQMVEKRLNKIPPKMVDGLIKKAVVYLKTLKEESKRGEMNDISPEMLMRLADYIEAVARSVEQYTITYMDAVSLNSAVTASIKKIESIFNAA